MQNSITLEELEDLEKYLDKQIDNFVHKFNVELLDCNGKVLYDEVLTDYFNINDVIERSDIKDKSRIDIRKTLDAINKEHDLDIKVILIVDDSLSLLKFVQKEVRLLGHYIEILDSGAKAFVNCNKNPDKFDYIIIDYDMPHVKGDRLLRNLKSVVNTAKLAVLTGQEEVGVELSKEGFIPLVKPICFRKLLGSAFPIFNQRS